MANVALWGAVYADVPQVLLPKSGGGTAQFDDTSDADATAADIASGKTAYVNGQKLTGTGSGGSIKLQSKTVTPSETQQIVTPDSEGYVYYINTTLYSDTIHGGSSPYIEWNTFSLSETPTVGETYDVSMEWTRLRNNKKYSFSGQIVWQGYGNTSVVLRYSSSQTVTAVLYETSIHISVSNVDDDGPGDPLVISISQYREGFDALSSVTVNSIPQEYCIAEPLSVTQNGTYTAPTGTAYSPVTVNVSGGGGSSNVVTGTFKGTTAGAAMDVTLNYTGNGYPLVIVISPSEGVYNSAGTFYSLVQRYACSTYTWYKNDPTSTPTYKSTGSAKNKGTVVEVIKNSTSDSTNYSAVQTTYLGSNGVVVLNGSESNGSAASNIVKFKANDKMSVFIASTSYGFAANIEYTYHVIYSE